MALAACSGEEPWPPPLFDCAGQGGRYVLRSLNDGELVLEIEHPPKGDVGISTWMSSWSDVRTGLVAGQMGGRQSHLRLFDGKQHIILFEGENGLQSDAPGATYAGVALVDDNSMGEPREIAACQASPTNRALIENVRSVRAAANAPELADEEVGGSFDMWF